MFRNIGLTLSTSLAWPGNTVARSDPAVVSSKRRTLPAACPVFTEARRMSAQEDADEPQTGGPGPSDHCPRPTPRGRP
jgi:hypothetical protein